MGSLLRGRLKMQLNLHGAHLKDPNESPYLFNVSFTRAKKKLIIIGDLNYLRQNMNRFPQKVRNMFDIMGQLLLFLRLE